MMRQRVIAGISGILLLLAGVGTATAQTSPTVPEETTTTAVRGESTTTSSTTTTEATTTTTEATTTTDAPTTTSDVGGDVVVRPVPGPAVRGDVVSRPLPRTGDEIGGTAVFGGALTILGIGMALGARLRRNRFHGV